MAPPSSAQPAGALSPLPLEAVEFLLFLSKAEEAVKVGGPAEEEPEVWRAKLCAYEASLQELLRQWKGLSDSAMECYRSRIEELRPANERALERRSAAQRLAQSPPAAPHRSPAAVAAAWAAAAARSSTHAAPAAAEAEVAEGEEVMAGPGHSAGPSGEVVGATSGAAAAAAAAAIAAVSSSPASTADVELPWRRRDAAATRQNRRAHLGKAAVAARGQIEAEMVELSEGMKGAASTFLQSLKSDNQLLSDMADSQQKSLDKVTAETLKGRKLARSSQLSFFCTLVMLITSLIIFVMMIPFIIIT